MTAFALASRVPEEALNLEELSLCIARMRRPELNPAEVSARLDQMAAEVADVVLPGLPPDRLARALREAFGGRLDLHGDPDNYYNPDNSYIDQVIATRRGLPILLAVVWILLGERLGVPIAGVNFPGHFLICINDPSARIYLDPFTGGEVVDPASLLERLGRADRQQRQQALAPCGVKPIVVRMLTNLKHTYVDQGVHDMALNVIDRIQLLVGEAPNEVRDRGLVLLHLGRPAEGFRDLRRYLELSPDAPDQTAIERLMEQFDFDMEH